MLKGLQKNIFFSVAPHFTIRDLFWVSLIMSRLIVCSLEHMWYLLLCNIQHTNMSFKSKKAVIVNQIVGVRVAQSTLPSTKAHGFGPVTHQLTVWVVQLGCGKSCVKYCGRCCTPPQQSIPQRLLYIPATISLSDLLLRTYLINQTDWFSGLYISNVKSEENTLFTS